MYYQKNYYFKETNSVKSIKQLLIKEENFHVPSSVFKRFINRTRAFFRRSFRNGARGPDAPGRVYEYENYRLGHNRLSILDITENSNQPYLSDDKRYVLIYNGEIYNYKELASQYSIHLENNSDTELLLKLSLKIGFEQALEKFNGMFAYLILDKVERKIFVARDRLGIKPLYYYHKGEVLIFLQKYLGF